ncbi:Aminomethyltransferase folate-binding domain-containing protein [Dentipellis sp. KUC8613]|nr:Aminomethyltransferase folate-binding domain-containing protein [Dentipellis sp. KUC8613]
MPLPPSIRALLHAAPSTARIPARGLLSVRGRDAPDFLNGLLASSVSKTPAPAYSIVLNAQGRILYDVFVHLHPDFRDDAEPHYVLEYATASPLPSASESDSPAVLPLTKFFRRHLLRQDVRLRDLTAEYDVWAAWPGSNADTQPREWAVAKSGVVEPVIDAAEAHSAWGGPGLLQDRRAAGLGTHRLVRKGDDPLESRDHDIASPADYLLHRIAHGVPEGVIDLPPGQAFPFESNIDMMGGVSVRKGCYIGQELTSRTYHTGAIRKRILPIMLEPITSTLSPSSSTIPNFRPHLSIRASHSVSPNEDGVRRPRPRGTGKLLTNVNGVGLALLRLEHVEAALRGELAFELDYSAEQGDVSTNLPSAWTGGIGEDEVKGASDDGRQWKVTPWWPEGLPARTEDEA